MHIPYTKAPPLMVWAKKIFSFFFWLPLQPQFFMEVKILKYSESESPKNHFCKVSLKLLASFRAEDFLSNCLRTDRRVFLRDGLLGLTSVYSNENFLTHKRLILTQQTPLTNPKTTKWTK